MRFEDRFDGGFSNDSTEATEINCLNGYPLGSLWGVHVYAKDFRKRISFQWKAARILGRELGWIEFLGAKVARLSMFVENIGLYPEKQVRESGHDRMFFRLPVTSFDGPYSIVDRAVFEIACAQTLHGQRSLHFQRLGA
jgi:hypothetical protein